MTQWDEAALKRRQRWFPRLAFAAAVIMAIGYVLLDVGQVDTLLAAGLSLAALVGLTAAALFASVSPRDGGLSLVAAAMGVIVLRVILGALASLVEPNLLVTISVAALSVTPLLLVGLLYRRRLR